MEEGKSQMIQEHTPITPTRLYCKEAVCSWMIMGLERNEQLRQLGMALSAPDQCLSSSPEQARAPHWGPLYWAGKPIAGMQLQPQVAAMRQGLRLTQGGSKPSFPGKNRPSTPSIAVAPKLVSSMQRPPAEIHKADKCTELGYSACELPWRGSFFSLGWFLDAHCTSRVSANTCKSLRVRTVDRSGSPPRLSICS